MTDFPKHLPRDLVRPRSRGTQQHRPKRRQSVLILLLLLLLWSVCLGLGLAQATEPHQGLEAIATETYADAADPSKSRQTAAIGTVDVVPDRYQLSQEIYLGTCATCHIGIPPAVLPSETWRQLLQDTQHYGVEIPEVVNPNLRIIWQYLRTYSRPQFDQEETPYRIEQSRYFKALHPKVEMPPRLRLSSCISCHPGAGKYDFRSLSAEWQNAP